MAHRLVQACRFTGDSGTHTHSKAPKKLSCKEDNPAKAMEMSSMTFDLTVWKDIGTNRLLTKINYEVSMLCDLVQLTDYVLNFTVLRNM